jgi:hypothetical protein
MTYGRFLEYLEMGLGEQVDLYDSLVEMRDFKPLVRAWKSTSINPNWKYLWVLHNLSKVEEYNINFDAHPAPRKYFHNNPASNLLLPVIFLSEFNFLFQNSENFHLVEDNPQ